LKTEYYITLGYVPNLGYGKGKANRQTSTEKLQDQHDCIRLITDQVARLRDQGYFWTSVFGRVVKVHVWIHIVAGDTSGHNECTGKFNSNGNTACPWRDCLCQFGNLSDSIAQCELITLRHVEEAAQSDGGLASLSMHHIDNAFSHTPLSDQTRGIFGITPPETLHVLGGGVLPYIFACITQLIGPNKSKQAEKDAYDSLHQHLVNDVARQSEKDFPRSTVRNGFGDGTKMSSVEAVGNLHIQLCVSYTQSGIDLLRDGWATHRISQKEYRDTIKLILGFERWINEPIPMEDIEPAIALVGVMIDGIKKCFPRLDGNGWDLPKVHGLAKMIYYVCKFGMAKNFSGSQGESALKHIVKNHADQTQRRANVFAEQVALRRYETEVFQYAFEDIRPILGLDYARVVNNDANSFRGEGKFTMEFKACD